MSVKLEELLKFADNVFHSQFVQPTDPDVILAIQTLNIVIDSISVKTLLTKHVADDYINRLSYTFRVFEHHLGNNPNQNAMSAMSALNDVIGWFELYSASEETNPETISSFIL